MVDFAKTQWSKKNRTGSLPVSGAKLWSQKIKQIGYVGTPKKGDSKKKDYCSKTPIPMKKGPSVMLLVALKETKPNHNNTRSNTNENENKESILKKVFPLTFHLWVNCFLCVYFRSA